MLAVGESKDPLRLLQGTSSVCGCPEGRLLGTAKLERQVPASRNTSPNVTKILLTVVMRYC